MAIIHALVAAAAVGAATLLPGPSVRRAIAGGDVHTYRVDLRSNQFVTCRVDQGDVDLAISVLTPAGGLVSKSDQFDRGPELVAFVSIEAGAYVLDVRPVAANTPRTSYSLGCEAIRSKRPADDTIVEAQGEGTEARQLFKKRDRESLTQAVTKRTHALATWRELGARDLEVATLASLGDTLYRSSRYADAEAIYREARSLTRSADDRRTLAEILTNLAATARPQNKLFEALDWLRQALEIWRTLRRPSGEAIALTNRGVLLRESGRYDEARRDHTRALAIFRRLRDWRGEAYALNNLAIVLEDLNRRQEALAHLSRAIPMFQRGGDRVAIGRALVNRARIQLAVGSREAALASATRGLALVLGSPDRLAEAEAREQLGRAYAASGDRVRARAEYQLARDAYAAVGSRKGESHALHDAGLAWLAAGDVAAAVDHFEQALALRRAAELRSLEADTLIQLARAERMRGNPERATAHASRAVSILEGLHAGVVERELRASHFSLLQRYYSEYIDAIVDRHRREPDAAFAAEAFEVSERARARGLYERLLESRLGIASRVDAGLARREREVRDELNYWSWILWQQTDRQAGDADTVAKDKVRHLLATHAALEADMLLADSRYAALLTPATASIADLRRDVLDDRTVLLEYALGDERSYLFAVTTDDLRVVDLPGRTEIERRARRFHRLVSVHSEESVDERRASLIRRDGAELSRVLLAPVASTLNRHRLLIVPDGAIHDVPFAMLSSPGERSALVARRELVMLPSASVLTFLRKDAAARHPAPKLLAVFGDPVFDQGDSRIGATTRAGSTAVATSATNALVRRVSRLPYSGDEADTILALAAPRPTLRAVNFDASRDRALSLGLGEYRYVHFATHTIRDDAYPELSGIVLSLVRRDGSPQDGFLRLHDILNLRLAADLVVLSGCETGVGRNASGEGLSGLAHGFFYAGAARLLVTLWKVDDEATSVVMGEFYRALLGDDEPSPAAALRSAQIAMQRHRRFADPYYWSGFVLEGQP